MANIILRKQGEYAVLDMEYVSAEYSGAGLFSQELELDATDFATDVAENGMCLTVVGNKVKKPAVGDMVKILATECEIYEEGKGRNTFAVKRGKGSQPRLVTPVSGDCISTNAVLYDNTEFTDLSALKTAVDGGTVKAIPSTTGFWKLTATTTGAKVIGEVIAVVNLSNEEIGVRIRF